MKTLDFTYNEKKIRTLIVNDEIHFVGVDICRILGYSDPDIAIKKLDEDERYLTRVRLGSDQTRKAWMVNEAGLYTLILTSTKPEAKAFKRWVTHEVLPQIRKAGKYSSEAVMLKELELQQIIKDLDKNYEEINLSKSMLRVLKSKQKNFQIKLFARLKEDNFQTKIKFPEAIDEYKPEN